MASVNRRAVFVSMLLLLTLAVDVVWVTRGVGAVPSPAITPNVVVKPVVPDYTAEAAQLDPGHAPALVAPLLKITFEQGLPAALDELDLLLAKGKIKLNDMHDITHAIGNFSIQKYADPAEAFALCRVTTAWACYHGVAMGYIHGQSREPHELAQLCDSAYQRTTETTIGSCEHGVGHALYSELGSDLLRTLTYCDAFPTNLSQYSCGEGAFSQLERSTQPHKAKYPCAEVTKTYRRGCYMYQVRQFSVELGYNWAAIAQRCASIDPEYKLACYEGLGGIINGATQRNLVDSEKVCSTVGLDAREFCVIGAMRMDTTAVTPQQASKLCSSVRSVAAVESCAGLIGSTVRIHRASPVEVSRLCGQLTIEKYRLLCETYSVVR